MADDADAVAFFDFKVKVLKRPKAFFCGVVLAADFCVGVVLSADAGPSALHVAEKRSVIDYAQLVIL